MCYEPGDEGQDDRGVDLVWPLWTLLDATPQGRGTENFMQLSYASTGPSTSR